METRLFTDTSELNVGSKELQGLSLQDSKHLEDRTSTAIHTLNFLS